MNPIIKAAVKQFLPDINTPYFEESEIEVSLVIDFVNNQSPIPVNKIKLSDNIDSGMLKIKDDYVGFKYFQDQQ